LNFTPDLVDDSRPDSLRPRKSLGQHFLRDENIARKIVAAIDPAPDQSILEVGAGRGALTKYLASRVRRLIAVEIDPRAARVLREAFAGAGVEIVMGDFLTLEISGLLRGRAGASRGRVRIVGNIPYNITSPILFHVLENRASIIDCTFMMQKEVARRLVAVPRTKAYGILSVLFQMFADVRLLFDVSAHAFTPRPRVTSSVVRLTLLPAPRYPLRSEEFFRTIVRAAFGKRRKTLRNSLAPHLAATPVAPAIDLQRRAEQLSVAELAELSNLLYYPAQ
jgi:16S rRNA (adenine1518-N6/adenine1519-N6)-dimethyltransferase